MITDLSYLGITARDWLQSVSMFLGVGATILGTLFIEHKMRGANDREDVSRILEVVGAVADAAGDIRAGLPDDATNFEHFKESFTKQTTLKNNLEMYRFVRADTKVKDLKLWRALKTFDEELNIHGKIIEKELQVLARDGDHTKVFDINRQKVMAAAEPIDDAARKILSINA